LPGGSITGAIIKAAWDALFPRKCPGCGSFFHAPRLYRKIPYRSIPAPAVFKILFAPYVCPDCLETFNAIEPPLCSACGRPFAGEIDTDHLCGDCLKKRDFHAARACGIYTNILRALIHAYKYEGRTQFARPLAALLFHFYAGLDEFCDINTVIPVPLHPARLRERGFNQAHLMITYWPAFSESGGLKKNFTIDARSLIRTRKTETQTGLDRAGRIKNVKGAFCVKQPSSIKGKKILLVDDVYTTGSTVSECAKTLMKAGAARVSVLTLARVV